MPTTRAVLTAPAAGQDANTGLNGPESLTIANKHMRIYFDGQWKGVPEGRIRASGHMGQYTMVIPSRDAVIVRLGLSPQGSDGYFSQLASRVLAALPH